MKTKILLLIALFLVLAVPSVPAHADGIIIPQPPICDPECPPPPCPERLACPQPSPMVQLAVRYHHVTVKIQDQLAITHVDQVFYNPNSWAVEGTYLFPLPQEAAVSAFTLWVDGKPIEGQILDAEQARQKYQEIVSSLRDPALLEYAGRGAVQAQIFPIPPKGERRIELEYTQALAAENGLVRFVYPLNTEKFSAYPLEEVSISVDVQAGVPIRAVYSPSHNVEVSREDEQHVQVGYEAKDVLPDTDFALYYSLGETQAFHLLTYREPGSSTDEDGFFLLLLAPQPDVGQTILSKDVLLVLDRSGSMDGDKFQQAQDALKYILGHLNAEDRFNMIAFSTGLETYASQMRPANEASQALNWVNQLSAQGSTDINRALLEAAAMADRERPTYVIFLTDGLPTEGEVDSQKILNNLAAAAPDNLRLFVFGVGYDVDTYLLDSLAQAHHGTSTYVLPGERLDETLSSFYAKISTPVLTNLALDFGSVAAYDLYPSPLADLFRDSQIILVGRYRQGSTTTVTLTGDVNGETQTFQYPDQDFITQPAADANATLTAIPRLWATRKIGYLLNQVRLNGPNQETIDQIVRLSIRYGIVTPYTSYLVTEDLPLGAAKQERIARQQYNNMQAAPLEAATGAQAVQKAADQGSMAAAEAPAAQAAAAANRVRIAGGRTFVLSGEKWVDTTYDPDKMQTVKVAFLSPEYFKLARARSELAEAFSLGQNVIALSGGIAYEVVPSGTQTGPVNVPPTFTPPPASVTESSQAANTPAPSSAPRQTPAPALPAAATRQASGPCAAGLLPLLLLGWLAIRRHW